MAFLFGIAGFGNAQSVAPASTTSAVPARLLVFLDCPMCDSEYLRQNVEFIEYVRDRTVADVHVLVTTEGTGGGGAAWTVNFIGQNKFRDQGRKLNFTTPQTATGDDRRKEFARVFRIGLVGYAVETSAAPELDVTWKRPPQITSRAAATKDAWNFWVFRVGASGNMSGEQSSNNRSLRFNFSASRTTEAWKLNVSTFSSNNESTFKVSDDLTIKSRTNSWNLNSLAVKSVNSKWSVGSRTSINHSSFSNIDHAINVSPAIEYDFFPYSESSRRSLTLQYSAGMTSYNYRDLTIFDKLQERVPNHAFNASIGLRQPWGSVGGTANFSQHLNHMDRQRITFFGNTEVRLFKGFSFNVFGDYERISDQIGLKKGDATSEEVLLRLRQLATGYSYFVNFGFSYSFGSIFNSTVNPRFGGSGF